MLDNLGIMMAEERAVTLLSVGTISLVFYLALISPVDAGMDFRYMTGHGFTLRQATQQFVEGIKTKNKEQAQVAYERIQQILREMPDKSRNAELLAQYQIILEKIRQSADESYEVLVSSREGQTMFEDLKKLVGERGAHVVTYCEPVRISANRGKE